MRRVSCGLVLAVDKQTYALARFSGFMVHWFMLPLVKTQFGLSMPSMIMPLVEPVPLLAAAPSVIPEFLFTNRRMAEIPVAGVSKLKATGKPAWAAFTTFTDRVSLVRSVSPISKVLARILCAPGPERFALAVKV